MYCFYQVELINRAIDNAGPGSRLRGLPHVSDPSDEVVEVLIQCMDWNIASCQSRLSEADLTALHQQAVDLLDLLQKNLPEKTGEKAAWNFEKAHSILHKAQRRRSQPAFIMIMIMKLVSVCTRFARLSCGEIQTRFASLRLSCGGNVCTRFARLSCGEMY